MYWILFNSLHQACKSTFSWYWFGDFEFHSSHRANLLRKDYEYYSQFKWKEDATNPYTWYDTEKKQWYLQHVGTGIREYV